MGLYISNCIICGKKVDLYDHRASTYLSLPPDIKIKKCSCGMRWLYPIPDMDNYKDIYSENYYSSDLLGKGTYEELIKFKYSWFALTVNNLTRKYPKHKKLLDIGAATGDFIKIACHYGYDADGIELSEYACKEALLKNNITLFNGTIQNYLEYSGNTLYDIIHMGHVFEHFTAPEESLYQIRNLLKADGKLIIEVPNQFNSIEDIIKLYLLKDKIPFSPMSLHHPFFYSKDSITKLLKKAGYKIDYCTTNPKGRYFNKIGFNKIIRRNLFRFVELALGMGPYIEIYASKEHDFPNPHIANE